MLNNESDKNVMEVYLIDKYKPILNNDCVEDSNCNLEIKEPVFGNIINL